MYRSETLRLVAWGPYGLFTRPETRADRVSYLVCTPPAGAGIAKAVNWHPEADIKRGEVARADVDVSRIWVLNPIDMITMKVNEMENLPLVSEIGATCTIKPRQTTLVLLRDPSFLIEFEYVSPDRDVVVKLAEMFKRRLAKGQHFRHPCFGRRRYPCFVREATKQDRPIPEDDDFGRISLGIEYRNGEKILHTFHAKMRVGVIEVNPTFFSKLEREDKLPWK